MAEAEEVCRRGVRVTNIHRAAPMKKKLCWVAAPVACGLAVYLTGAARWAGRAIEKGVPHPELDAPRQIDLGTVDVETPLEVSVPVRNRGREVLKLEELRTNCSCQGIFLRDRSGRSEKVTDCQIPPDGEVSFVLQMALSAASPGPGRQFIRFRTNDPDNREVEIELLVTPQGRLMASPATLALGAMAVGEGGSHRVFIHCPGPQRAVVIERIETKLPAQCRAAFSPTPAEPVPALPNSGPCLGAITLTVSPGDEPLSLDGEIQVFVAGRAKPALTVPVMGRFARPVELIPTELHLPRASNGGPVYSAVCVCRAVRDMPLALRCPVPPEGLEIQIEDDPSSPAMKLVRIDGSKLHRITKNGSKTAHVSFVAEQGGRSQQLELTVIVGPER